MGRVFIPYESSGLVNPTISFFFSSVGLNHTLLTVQVTWRDEERRIGGASEDPGVDRVERRPPDLIKARARLKSYNGFILRNVAA